VSEALASSQSTAMASEEGTQELPEGWNKWWSERRKKFYYHHEETGTVQWEPPGAPPSPSKRKSSSPNGEAVRSSQADSKEAATVAGQGVAAARKLQPSTSSSAGEEGGNGRDGGSGEAAGGATAGAGVGVAGAAAEAGEPSASQPLSSTSTPSLPSFSGPDGSSPTKQESSEAADPPPQSSELSDQVGQETVQLLQNLLSYYNYDPSAANLVQITLSSLPSASIDGRDEAGNTLLLLAVQYNAHDMVKPLIEKGASVNAVNRSGSAPIHYACSSYNSNLDSVRILLDHSADASVQESSESGGMTPLHYAAEAGNTAICELLLERGGDPDQTDAYGRSPPQVALEQGHVAVAELFTKVLDSSSQFPTSAVARDIVRQSVGGGVAGGVGGGAAANDMMAEVLQELRGDLRRAQGKIDEQRREYEELLRDKDHRIAMKQDTLAKVENQARMHELNLERAKSEATGLHRRVSELQQRLAKVEAEGEEEKAGKAKALARLDTKLTHLEGDLAAERKKLEFEQQAKEQILQELRAEKDQSASTLQEHLKVVRENAHSAVQLAQNGEKLVTLEKELEKAEALAKQRQEEAEEFRRGQAGLREELGVAKGNVVLHRERAAFLEKALQDASEHQQQMVELVDQLRSDSSVMRNDLHILQEELTSKRGAAAAEARRRGLEEELAEARGREAVLQSEVDRLKAAEAKALFNDQSRIAIELATLQEENTRLQTNLADVKKQQPGSAPGDAEELAEAKK